MEQRQAVQGTRKSKQDFWEQQVKGWRNSGLTQDQYCREHGLKKTTFFYWRRKLDQTPRKNSLVPVSITSQEVLPANPVPSGVSLKLRGCLIQVDKGFDQKTLLELVQVLRAA